MLNPFLAPKLADHAQIKHGFFTREGGVSSNIYDSLNCGRGSKDDPTAVHENRNRVAHHLGAMHSDVLTPYQVHSPDVFIAEDLIAADDLPKADGVVTARPGLAIGILTADCTPVLFADPEAKVVGAAHAGWRGALSGVLANTVKTMESLGADRARMHVAIGPCIHQAAYEVGPEFKQALADEDIENEAFFVQSAPNARPHFDLPAYVKHKLKSLEIGTIETIDHCTRQNESKFFSYRRSQSQNAPDYGRQISAILVA